MKVSHNRIWKLALLGIQFCLSGGLICMLVLIGLQYRTVSNYDMGYDYSDIGMVKIENKWKDGAAKVMEELRKLSCVEVVGSGSQNFVTMASGGEIWEDERPDVVLPIADMMNVNREIFDVLGLKFIQGGTFPENPSEDMNAVVVDERMIKGCAMYSVLRMTTLSGEGSRALRMARIRNIRYVAWSAISTGVDLDWR